MPPARILDVAALALLAAACNSSPDRPDKAPPPPRPVAASAAETASAPPEAPGSAAPEPAATSKTLLALQGPWGGSYDAKKGAVAVPDKAKNTRGSDDGKTASGPGKVELTISAAGEIRGKATGALGPATLSGKADGDTGAVRVSWFPDDPTAANAMTGVLIGFLKEGQIRGEIRVAGPDASIVRESKIELARK